MMRRQLSLTRFFKIKNILVIVAISAVIFTLLFFLRAYFKIDQIKVISNNKNIKLSGLEQYKNTNLLLASEENIKKSIYVNNSFIKKVEVRKEFPNVLTISVQTAKSSALLKVDQGYFLLTEEGRIIEKSKTKKSSIPTISYYQKLAYSFYEKGDLVNFRDIQIALYFIKFLNDSGLKVESVDINGLNMIRLQMDSKIVLFTTDKDIEVQKYQFETVWRQFKIEGKEFKTLDLRFEKPVVTLKN